LCFQERITNSLGAMIIAFKSLIASIRSSLHTLDSFHLEKIPCTLEVIFKYNSMYAFTLDVKLMLIENLGWHPMLNGL
jgi:hypothetical protein